MTKLIKNPFDTFCLFLEGFSKKGYMNMNLDYVEGKIMMIQGQGTILSQANFFNFLSNYDIPEEILY